MKQLKVMELGGNKRAREYFREHGVQGKVDYSSPMATRWKQMVSDEADKELAEETSAAAPEQQIPT
jgi:hypothetical protein